MSTIPRPPAPTPMPNPGNAGGPESGPSFPVPQEFVEYPPAPRTIIDFPENVKKYDVLDVSGRDPEVDETIHQWGRPDSTTAEDATAQIAEVDRPRAEKIGHIKGFLGRVARNAGLPEKLRKKAEIDDAIAQYRHDKITDPGGAGASNLILPEHATAKDYYRAREVAKKAYKERNKQRKARERMEAHLDTSEIATVFPYTKLATNRETVLSRDKRLRNRSRTGIKVPGPDGGVQHWRKLERAQINHRREVARLDWARKNKTTIFRNINRPDVTSPVMTDAEYIAKRAELMNDIGLEPDHNFRHPHSAIRKAALIRDPNMRRAEQKTIKKYLELNNEVERLYQRRAVQAAGLDRVGQSGTRKRTLANRLDRWADTGEDLAALGRQNREIAVGQAKMAVKRRTSRAKDQATITKEKTQAKLHGIPESYNRRKVSKNLKKLSERYDAARDGKIRITSDDDATEKLVQKTIKPADKAANSRRKREEHEDTANRLSDELADRTPSPQAKRRRKQEAKQEKLLRRAVHKANVRQLKLPNTQRDNLENRQVLQAYETKVRRRLLRDLESRRGVGINLNRWSIRNKKERQAVIDRAREGAEADVNVDPAAPVN